MEFSARRRRALALAEEHALDALLITTQPDLRYLCGFAGSAGALVLRRRGSAFFTDGRYEQQARSEVKGIPVHAGRRAASAAAVPWLYARGVRRCGVEETRTTLAEWSDLRRLLPPGYRRGVFRPVRDLIASLRTVKDTDEISVVRKAAALGDRMFEAVLRELVPARSEATIADFLLQTARELGAEAMSFDTIVASGKRSALPHGRASSVRLPRRGFVTLDFGVVYQGYCSDMTRTVFLGSPTRFERLVYDSVLEAQRKAIDATAPGIEADAIDTAARNSLSGAGLAKHFTHSTGHGVGLEIHEAPRIGARQKDVLREGMVITIEPGAYLAEKFGVRIEDMLLVTASGNQVLTQSPKTLIEL